MLRPLEQGQNVVPYNASPKSSGIAASVAQLREACTHPAVSYGLTSQLKPNCVVVLSTVGGADQAGTARYVVRCDGKGLWRLRKETGLHILHPALHLVTVCENGRVGLRSALAEGKLLRCDKDFCLTFASWQLGTQETWSLRGYSIADCVLWHSKFKLALNVCITIVAEPCDSLGNIRITSAVGAKAETVASDTEALTRTQSPSSAVSTLTGWSQLKDKASYVRSFSLKSGMRISKDRLLETATEIHVSQEDSPTGQKRKLQRWSWSRKRELDNADYSTPGSNEIQSQQGNRLPHDNMSNAGVLQPEDEVNSRVTGQSHSAFLQRLVKEVESSSSRLETYQTQLLNVALHKVKENALIIEKEKGLKWKLQAAVLVLKALTKQKLQLITENARLEAHNKLLSEERERDLQVLLTEMSRLRTELWVNHNKTQLEAHAPSARCLEERDSTRTSATYHMVRKSVALNCEMQESTKTHALSRRFLLPLSLLPLPILTVVYAIYVHRRQRKHAQRGL